MVEQKGSGETFDSYEALDKSLGSFRDPGKEGHVMISPRAARTIALNWLLEEHRAERAAWEKPTNPGIEVLVQIAGDSDELVDFTQRLEELKRQRAEEMAKKESFWSILNLFGPRRNNPKK